MMTAKPPAPEVKSEAQPGSLRPAVRVVNGLLAVKPLANLIKRQARQRIIKRAESIGVPWRRAVAELRQREATFGGSDLHPAWEKELVAIAQPDLVYPDYYQQPFHAYEAGNLSWEAALEVEVASQAVHARIWPDGGKAGDQRLRQSYQAVLDAVLPEPPRAIVDVGCATGLSTETLAQAYPEATVTGVDLSPYFLAIAQYRYPAHAQRHWHHAAAEAMPLPTGQYDLVSLSLVCHELPQAATRQILQEVRRLLRPGGHLAIMDMDPHSELHRSLPPYVLTLLKSTEPHLDAYFALDLPQAIVEAGFAYPEQKCNSPRHRTLVARVLGSPQ